MRLTRSVTSRQACSTALGSIGLKNQAQVGWIPGFAFYKLVLGKPLQPSEPWVPPVEKKEKDNPTWTGKMKKFPVDERTPTPSQTWRQEARSQLRVTWLLALDTHIILLLSLKGHEFTCPQRPGRSCKQWGTRLGMWWSGKNISIDLLMPDLLNFFLKKKPKFSKTFSVFGNGNTLKLNNTGDQPEHFFRLD